MYKGDHTPIVIKDILVCSKLKINTVFFVCIVVAIPAASCEAESWESFNTKCQEENNIGSGDTMSHRDNRNDSIFWLAKNGDTITVKHLRKKGDYRNLIKANSGNSIQPTPTGYERNRKPQCVDLVGFPGFIKKMCQGTEYTLCKHACLDCFKRKHKQHNLFEKAMIVRERSIVKTSTRMLEMVIYWW